MGFQFGPKNHSKLHPYFSSTGDSQHTGVGDKIPISFAPTTYTASDPDVGGHFDGIDNFLGTLGAGDLQSAYDNGPEIKLLGAVQLDVKDNFGAAAIDVFISGPATLVLTEDLNGFDVNIGDKIADKNGFETLAIALRVLDSTDASPHILLEDTGSNETATIRRTATQFVFNTPGDDDQILFQTNSTNRLLYQGSDAWLLTGQLTVSPATASTGVDVTLNGTGSSPVIDVGLDVFSAGDVINISYDTNETLTGVVNLIRGFNGAGTVILGGSGILNAINIDFGAQVAAITGPRFISGTSYIFPSMTVSTSGGGNVRGFDVDMSGQTLTTQTNVLADIRFFAYRVVFPDSLTQTTGTLTAYGLEVIGPNTITNATAAAIRTEMPVGSVTMSHDMIGAANTTKSTAGTGAFNIQITDDGGNFGVNGNIFSVRAQVSGSQLTRLLLDEDGDLYVGTGLSSDPSYSFLGDDDTGMFQDGPNNLGFSTNGVARLLLSTTQMKVRLTQILTPVGNAGGPSYSFETDTNLGIYRHAADQLGISLGGAPMVIADAAITLVGINDTNGRDLFIKAEDGGLDTGTSGGLIGADITWSAGDGSNSVLAAATGGFGGIYTINAGDGGDSAGASGTAGNGGNIVLNPGTAGAANGGAAGVDGLVRVNGKLTVTGAIDPTSVGLSGGTALFFESANGSTAPVSGAATGRLRYNNTAGEWQQSVQGGAYTTLGGGGAATSLNSTGNVDIVMAAGNATPLNVGANIFSTGTIFDIAYDTAEVLTGDITGMSMNFVTNLTSGLNSIRALDISVPSSGGTQHTFLRMGRGLVTSPANIAFEFGERGNFNITAKDSTFTIIDIAGGAIWQNATAIALTTTLTSFGGSNTVRGMLLDFSTVTNLSDTGLLFSGYAIQMPGDTHSGAGTTVERVGFNIESAGAIDNSSTGTLNWRGVKVQMPTVTQTSGTTIAHGIRVVGALVSSGTAAGVFVNMNAAADVAMHVNTGRVGIGTASPDNALEVLGITTSTSTIRSTGITVEGVMELARANGSEGTPTALALFQDFGVINMVGHDGSSFSTACIVRATTNANWTGSSHPSSLEFLTTDVSSTTPNLQMTIFPDGDVRIENLGASLDVQTDGTGRLITVSDARAKDIHGPVHYGLNEIMKLDPVLFNYKTDPDGCRSNIGFTAQNVQAVIPEAVHLTGKGNYLGLNSRGIVAALVNAVKEQQQEIDQLKQQLT